MGHRLGYFSSRGWIFSQIDLGRARIGSCELSRPPSFAIEYVIAGLGHRVGVLGQLHLENHMPTVAEGDFGAA